MLAKKYSERAYDLSRMSGSPNDLIFDTHAWVLIQNGGNDVTNGVKILQDVVQRQPEIIDAHFHLGEGYLRQPQPSKMMARVELNKALELVRKEEGAGRPVDKTFKNKILTSLERATEAGDRLLSAEGELSPSSDNPELSRRLPRDGISYGSVLAAAWRVV